MIAQSAGCRGDVAGSLRNVGSMASKRDLAWGYREPPKRHLGIRCEVGYLTSEVGLCADSGRVMTSELIDVNRFVCGDDGLRHGVYERSR